MKTTASKILIILILGIVIFSCKKDETLNTAPELPPVETMIIDFSQFDVSKSAKMTKTNWIYSATTVVFWNVILGNTLAVPVAAFHSAIEHEPVKIDDLTWQWQYNVDGFTSNYSARLVGKLQSNQIKWEMYIAKTGINAFDEFLWFEGTSGLNGNNGQWLLYHSAEFPDKFLQIDWLKDGENIGQIIYTYVREENDNDVPDLYYGSTLTYGLQDNEFDAYINVHIYNQQQVNYTDTYIEWSRTNFNGRVKAEHYYNNAEWHCWDSEGNDTECD
ncbi:MAG: hypothetical protein JXR61_07685 [Prolixibacteraceae bacterium]|nr:hypothetical protein [Prolixibacteraceae bacterium]